MPPHVFGKSAQANENKRVSLRYENHQNALGKIERTEIPTKAFYTCVHACLSKFDARGFRAAQTVDLTCDEGSFCFEDPGADFADLRRALGGLFRAGDDLATRRSIVASDWSK